MGLDPKRTALLFPGQGSQFVGMGRELAESDAQASDLFHSADEQLGYSLSELCWNGPAEKLNDTLYTQPALLTHSIALLWAVKQRFPEFTAAFCAGHSMGQFSALVAAGSLEFPDALRLVSQRGRAMQQAGERSPGGMAAVLGMEIQPLEKVCDRASEETGLPVQIANDNCPGQVVISGADSALRRAGELAREAGAARVIPLAVSIAAHSALMETAQQAFNQALEEAPLSQAEIPILGNVSARPHTAPQELHQDLEKQLTSRVRWRESVEFMIRSGVSTFLEIGPGDVLTKLARRTDRSVTAVAVHSPESLLQIR